MLVTGGSGGIGAGVAARFAAAGAAVMVGWRTGAQRAAAVVDAVVAAGGAAASARADVTRPDECAELMASASRRFGGLDAVVACAGVQPVAPLPGMAVDEWQRVVEQNLTGAFVTLQAAARALGPGGSVTLVGSIEATRPAPGHAHYAASKAGAAMLARSAALEYGPAGLRVNSVSPGLVDRPGLEQDWPEGLRRWRAAAPLGRVGTPADIGDACVFLASPLASWITGHDLVVDGGMAAAPSW